MLLCRLDGVTVGAENLNRRILLQSPECFGRRGPIGAPGPRTEYRLYVVHLQGIGMNRVPAKGASSTQLPVRKLPLDSSISFSLAR